MPLTLQRQAAFNPNIQNRIQPPQQQQHIHFTPRSNAASLPVMRNVVVLQYSASLVTTLALWFQSYADFIEQKLVLPSGCLQ